MDANSRTRGRARRLLRRPSRVPALGARSHARLVWPPAHAAAFRTPLTGPLHPPPGGGTSPPLPFLALHPLLSPRLPASSPRLLPASLPGCSLLKDPGNHSFVHLFTYRSASRKGDHLCPQRARELVSRINRQDLGSKDNKRKINRGGECPRHAALEGGQGGQPWGEWGELGEVSAELGAG